MLVPSLEDYGVAARVDGLDKRPLHLRYPDRFLSGLNGLRSLSARDSNLLPSDHMYLLDGMMGPTPVYDMDEDGEEEGGSWEEAAWESDSGRGGTVLDDGTEPSGRERLGGGSRARRKRGLWRDFYHSQRHRHHPHGRRCFLSSPPTYSSSSMYFVQSLLFRDKRQQSASIMIIMISHYIKNNHEYS